MPKRKRDETEEDKWRRRIKKYEAKLNGKPNSSVHRVSYPSEVEHDIIENHLEYEQDTFYEPAGSVTQYDEYIDSDSIEDKLETESAPASHVIQCTAEVHAEPEILATNNTDVQKVCPAETSTKDEITVVNEDFDPELLRALGEFEADSIEWGENIHEEIAKHFQHTLLNGLKKEAKEELHKKYLFPKNLPFSKAPTLNPEIAAMLTEASRNRDKRILAKQEQIGKALSGLGKAMTLLLKKEPNIAEAIRTLSDVGKLVADAHFAETETRRSVVIPLVEKSLIDPFKNRKRDSFLFGEKLGDLVKSSRGIKKTGQLIQATSTAPASSSGLNWKPPPSRSRLQRGSQLQYPSRGGGHRGYSYYQTRHRAPQAGTPHPDARRRHRRRRRRRGDKRRRQCASQPTSHKHRPSGTRRSFKILSKGVGVYNF
ncbi:uncharacterized protein [Choristoneura fumiferana]|uniref:uncharacterized protein n=1 Tax=Choristoneura fumiferana TaxID=7141 RepID=UPI003D1583B8